MKRENLRSTGETFGHKWVFELRRELLELVCFLGIGETGEGLRCAATVDFDFYGTLGFGAGFAQQRVGGDSFVVNLSNQIRFAGIVFLPDLANLDFADRHSTNVDRFQ